jgi:chemotaxis protein MotB
MSAARRAGGRGHEDDSHDEPDERWAVSYSDMVTVLMCLFIVLFAMSNVDKGKFEQLANSLSAGFGQEETVTGGADISEGMVIPPELATVEGVEDLTARAAVEFESLEEIEARMRAALAAQGLEGAVEFVIDERGLNVGLIGAETFFANNSTTLSAKAEGVLNAIGGVIATIDNQVSVEGHADHRAAVAPFPTNWELSSGRATQVARFLVEQKGVAGPRMKATGFSDTRPSASGDSAEVLASNRRVDIVVESKEEEQVRALIPALSGAAASR